MIISAACDIGSSDSPIVDETGAVVGTVSRYTTDGNGRTIYKAIPTEELTELLNIGTNN